MSVKVKLKELKASYQKAVKNNDECFKLKDLEFLTSYAKYLLEYLENKKVKDEDYINLEQKN